jgi:hypothetical protein
MELAENWLLPDNPFDGKYCTLPDLYASKLGIVSAETLP